MSQLSSLAGDLKGCESEPLQFIGSIQNFGALIAFTIHDERIQAASENIKDVIGIAHRETLGAKLSHIVGAQNAGAVFEACKNLGPSSNRQSVALSFRDDDFDATIFSTDGLHFVEFEKLEPGAADLKKRFAQEDVVKRCLTELRQTKKLADQGFSLCRAVQKITGIDRVMLYRFLAPTMHGEVVAEHRVLSAHSFFQHRFPASDIPRIARDLYLRNGVRVISDTEVEISKVTPSVNPTNRKAIDLSDSRLRAVSPIHLEYLRNMKVRCSFSVAVVVDGKLWGLVACHHMQPLRISVSQRNACEVVAEAFAGMAGMVELSEIQSRRIGFTKKMRDLMDSVLSARNPVDQLMKSHLDLLEALGATGAALVHGSKYDLVGLCPPREQVAQLKDAVERRMNQEHVDSLFINSIATEIPQSEVTVQLASGLLASRVGSGAYLLIFRPEQIETIVWGGDPRKQLDKKGFEGRINPRTSFETWEETIKDHSIPWQDFEQEGFHHLVTTVFDRLVKST